MRLPEQFKWFVLTPGFANYSVMFRNLLSLLCCAVAVSAAERQFDFGQFADQTTPTNFRSAVTGRGAAGDWKVVMEDVPPILPAFSPKSPVATKRPVLAQLSSDREEARAPLFIYEGDTFGDFKFSTRFKITGGEIEQMAGVAFRVQDEKNYYYVRASAKGQNLAFFRYVQGELIGGLSVPTQVKRGDWNALMIECSGSKLRAFLNGQEVIPWTEPNLVPFPDGTSKGVFSAGKIAFWTKADSTACFTEARVEFTPRESYAQVLIRETMQQNPRLLGLKIFGVNGKDPLPRIIASNDEKKLGEAGGDLEKNCIEKGGVYFGKGNELAVVTMPLHDRNGDTVGAVRVEMTTFIGQTERNGLARAQPIVKSMEARITSAKELLQ
jgi:hypothetical protein